MRDWIALLALAFVFSAEPLALAYGPVNGSGAVVRITQPAAAADGQSVQTTAGPYGIQGMNGAAAIYASWGKMFTLGIPITSTASSSEQPFMLIHNPVGSGVTMKIRQIVYGVPQSGNTQFKVYLAPTCTVPSGTAQTPRNNNSASSNTSAVAFYSLPTCSANGTFLIEHTSFTGTPERPVVYDFSQWITPGKDVLITSTQSLIAQGDYVSFEYAETAE